MIERLLKGRDVSGIENGGNNIRKIERLKLFDNGPGHFKFNSFFAGIGGFDLGFERAGISPAFHCEINDFCRSVLKRHWPDLPYASDIRDVKTAALPDADVWCGGFPCQDVSVARGAQGRDGLKGKNSGLFYPFLSLITEKCPRVVLLENVTGLLSSHRGQDFRVILSSLTELGYGVAWRVMNARFFGAPQSRPRVFICAWKDRLDLALNTLYEKKGSGPVRNERRGFITPTKCLVTGACVPLVGYCLAATSGRHTGTDWSRTYVSYFDRVRRLTPIECEGLQGFPSGWSLPEADYPLCDDEIDTLRYHAIGNAVCVSLVEWIGRRIARALEGDENGFDYSKMSDVVRTIGEEFADFRTSRMSSPCAYSNEQGPMIRWKNGGAAYGQICIQAKTSGAPSKPVDKKLIEIIEKREVEEKYFLSPNAAKGILRRVTSQGRTLFRPLYEALQRLAGRQPDDNCIVEFRSKRSGI